MPKCVLLNCCGANGHNAFEFFSKDMHRGLLLAFEKVVALSNTPVYVYAKRDAVLRVADALELDSTVMLRLWDRVAGMRAGEFFVANDADRTVSFPERHTVEAKDGTLRPSFYTGVTHDFDVEAWAAFMAKVLPEVRPKLAKVNHAKYPAFKAKWEPVNVEIQIVHLMVYEAVTCGLLREAAYEAGMTNEELAAAIDDQTKVDRDLRLSHLIERYARFRDVFFLTEVSGRLFRLLLDRLGPRFEFVIPAGFEIDGKQNSIILYDKAVFDGFDVDAPEGALPVSPGSLAMCGVEDRMTNTKMVLVSAHAASSSSEATGVAKWLGGLGAPFVCGMDSNVVYREVAKPSELTYIDFCAGARALGLHVAGGKMTVMRKRTSLVVQKHGRIDDPPLTKPCDLFLHGDIMLNPVRVDNTGIGEFSPEPFPNDAWPSDHAAVHTSW